jgi:hypothetical protein
MANTAQKIQEITKVTRSPQDKGWQYTITIKVMDNGFYSINDMPSVNALSTARAAVQVIEEAERTIAKSKP